MEAVGSKSSFFRGAVRLEVSGGSVLPLVEGDWTGRLDILWTLQIKMGTWGLGVGGKREKGGFGELKPRD